MVCAIAGLPSVGARTQEQPNKAPDALVLIRLSTVSQSKMQLLRFKILEVRDDVMFVSVPATMTLPIAAKLLQDYLPELRDHPPSPVTYSAVRQQPH